MKLAYVAQDRVDIAEAVKCLTRHMKEPQSGHRVDTCNNSRGQVDTCCKTEMRVVVCTTNVRSNVAGACGL